MAVTLSGTGPILVQDTFVRANTAGNTTVSNAAGWGTSSDGNTWTDLHATDTPTFSINTNRGEVTTSALDNQLALSSNTYADAEVVVRLTTNVIASNWNGVMLRDTSGTTGYLCILRNTANAQLSIVKDIAGGTIIASAAFSWSSGVAQWIRFRAVGNQLYAKAWADGSGEPAAWTITTTDSTYTSGRVGVFSSPNLTTQTVFFDSLQVHDTTVPLTGVGTLSGTLSLSLSLSPAPVSQPLPYIGRGLLSTIIYEQRTFIPRALSGVYIPDTVMWVPRGMMSTVQSALLRSLTLAGVGTLTGTAQLTTALTTTLAGVSTLAETLSLATALTDTIPGVGTLAGTLSANVPLAVTIPGIGTLAGTLTETTALTTTLAGVGTLAGTLSANTALSTTIAGVGTLTGTLSANLALGSVSLAGIGILTGSLFAVSQPLPYIGRGLLSTIVYEQRTFVPRALSGVYIPDTILPVPRALLSTIQATIGLAGTLAGIGTLTETVSLSTVLATTLAGVGTLTGTLSGGGALSVTLPGVGTLAGTLSLATALTTTLAGVGTLTATASLATTLIDTLAGVGTLSGTITETTALLQTIAGVGILSATLSANLTLASVTMVGVGTLAATMTAQVILSTSLVGAGTLTGVFSLRTAFSLICAGAGTLTPTLSIVGVTTQFITVTWLTRDLQATWLARDGKITWNTRDEKAGWLTRDEQASWNTRDELATWKVRQ